MAEEFERRSRKTYDAARTASKYQKERFKEYAKRAADGESLVLLCATHPMELCLAMDIPFVVNQWYSALCGAKQLTAKYLDAAAAAGYARGMCAYCSTSFTGSFVDPDEVEPPYGVRLKPSIIVAEGRCSSSSKIMELYADRVGGKAYTLEASACLHTDQNWFDKTRYDWESLYEKDRLDYATESFNRFISFLEAETGKSLNRQKLIEVMNLINEQEEYYTKIRDLIVEREKTPITLPDLLPAIMQSQWNRGTPWAVEHAKNFYEEIKANADAGYQAVPGEKIRLAWIGLGFWSNLAFYQHFEEKYGAAFVWSMYLSIAADNYCRYNVEADPVRALASRDLTMGDALSVQPMNISWYLHDFKTHRIDGVVIVPDGSCPDHNLGSIKLTVKALEEAGFPVLLLDASVVDTRTWDQDKMVGIVENWLENRVIPNQNK